MSGEAGVVARLETSTNTFERAKWLGALTQYAMPVLEGQHALIRPDGDGGTAVVVESQTREHAIVTVLWEVEPGAYKIDSRRYTSYSIEEGGRPPRRVYKTLNKAHVASESIAVLAVATLVSTHMQALAEATLYEGFSSGALDEIAQGL